MNHTYRVVYNETTNTYTAVAEIATARGKKTKSSKTAIAMAVAALAGIAGEAGAAIQIGSTGTNTVSTSGTSLGSRAGTAAIAVGSGATVDRVNGHVYRQNPYNTWTTQSLNGGSAATVGENGVVTHGTATQTINGRAMAGIAIGNQSNSTGGGGVSIGDHAQDLAGMGVAIGAAARNEADSGTTLRGSSVAIGAAAYTSGNTALSIGRQASATNDFAQAIGATAAAVACASLAVGHSATATGKRGIAIGSADYEGAAATTGTQGAQAGTSYQQTNQTYASGVDSIAFGSGARATAEDAVAITAFSQATANQSLAIGHEAQSHATSSNVIGKNALAKNTLKDNASQAVADVERALAPVQKTHAGLRGAQFLVVNALTQNGVDSTEAQAIFDSMMNSANAITNGAQGFAAAVSTLKAYTFDTSNSTSIGTNAKTSSNDAIAVGTNANSSQLGSIVIGANSQLKGPQSGRMAVGRDENGDTPFVVIGYNSSSQSRFGDTIVGAWARTENPDFAINQGTVIGNRAIVYGDQGVAVGADTLAAGNSSVAIGGDDLDKAAQALAPLVGATWTDNPTNNATIGGRNITNVTSKYGSFQSETGLSTTVKGHLNQVGANGRVYPNTAALGDASLALGTGSQTLGVASNAIGANALAKGLSSTAIGTLSRAWGEHSISIGTNSNASGKNAIAVGLGNQVSGDNSGAFGDPSIIAGTNSYSLGNNHVIANNTDNAISIGGQNKIGGDATRNNGVVSDTNVANVTNAATGANRSMVIGFNNTVRADDVMVLGNNITVDTGKNLAGSVILGQNASTEGSHAIANETQATVNGITYGTFVGKVADTGRFVSVGAKNDERKIINLAAGNISASSTEAINGSQLYAVMKEMPAVVQGDNITVTKRNNATTGQVEYVVNGQQAGTPAAPKQNYFHTNNGSNAGGDATTNLGDVDVAAGATKLNSIAGGVNAISRGIGDIALGLNATTNLRGGAERENNAWGRSSSIAIGENATSTGTLGDVIVGAWSSNARMSGRPTLSQSTIIGSRSAVGGDQATAIGADVRALGNSSIAIGGDDVILAMNKLSTIGVTNFDGISETMANLSAAERSFLTGYTMNAQNPAYITGYNATNVAITGINMPTSAIGDASIAMGPLAASTGVASNAFGVNALARGDSSIAFGTASRTSDNRSVAIGTQAQALKNDAIAVGTKSSASGTESIAVGTENNVTGNKSVAVGYKNNVTGTDTFVLGSNVTAATSGSVVLGQDAKTEGSHTIATVTSANVNGVEYSGFVGAVANDGRFVSVGAKGDERKIINLAAGNISASSTEAINGSQLYAVMKEVPTVKGDGVIKVEKGTNANGQPEYTVSYTGETGGSDGNNITTVNSPKKTVSVKPTTTGSTTNYDLEVNYDNKTIVADPNGNLSVATTNLTNNPNGTVSAPTQPAGEGDKLVNATTVANAINQSGFNLTVASGTNGTLVNPGDTVDLKNTDGNIQITKGTDNNNVTFNLNNTVTIGNTAPTATNNNPIKIDGNNGTITGLAPVLPTNPTTSSTGPTTAPVANQAASISDVLNAGWNLKEKGAEKDFVRPYDTVDFIDGNATAVNVTTKDDGKTSEIKYDVKYDNSTITVSNGNLTVANTTLTQPTTTPETVAPINKPSDENSTKFVNAGDLANTLNNLGFNVNSGVATGTNGTTTGGTPAKTAVKTGDTVNFLAGNNVNIAQEGQNFTISANIPASENTTLTVENGKVKDPDPANKDGDKLVNASTVASAINNVSHNITIGTTKDEFKDQDGQEDSQVKAGDTIKLVSGKNLIAKQNKNEITFATADNVTFNNVSTSILHVPTDNPDSPITITKDGINAGDKPISNVNSTLTTYADEPRKDLVNLTAVPNNEVNNAATVKDLQRMGWIVSSDQTTGDAVGAVTADAYDKQVKNAEQVKFVGTGAAKVSGKTTDGVSTITVHVDESKVSTGTINNNDGTEADKPNGSVTADTTGGTVATVTNVADAINKSGFNLTVEDGTNSTLVNPGDAVDLNNSDNNIVITKGTDNNNVTFNLNNTVTIGTPAAPGSTTTTNPITIDGNNGTITGLAPVLPTNPTTSSTGPTTAPVANQAASISDVLNAGWNLKEKGAEKDFVRPYDTVDFIDGNATAVNVTTKDDGKTSEIKYDVKYDNSTITVSNGNLTVANTTLTQPTTTPETVAPINKPSDENSTKFVNAGDLANTLNNLGFNVNSGVATGTNGTTTGGTPAKTAVKTGDTVNFLAGNNVNIAQEGQNFTISANVPASENTTLTVENGKVKDPDPANKDGDKLVNASTVASAINNVSHNITIGSTKDTFTDQEGKKDSQVKAGDTITLVSGKNLIAKQNGNEITFATADDVTFNNVSTSILHVPTDNPDSPITITKDGISAGDKPISNVSSNLTNYTDDPRKPLVNLTAVPNSEVNNAATVSDLQRMGWVVSSDKTTGAETTPFSNAVTNAKEVKFVGTGVATVSGKLEGDVNTITVHVAEADAGLTTGNIYVNDGTDNNGSNASQPAGTVTPNTTNGTAATVADVANAVNNSGFKVTDNGKETNELLNAGETLNFNNGTGTTAVVETKDGVTNVTYNSALAYVDPAKPTDTSTPTDTVKVVSSTEGTPAQIQNVASGVRDTVKPATAGAPTGKEIADAIKAATGNTLTNAVNIGDLQAATNAARTEVKSEDGSITVTPSENATTGAPVYDVKVATTNLTTNPNGTVKQPDAEEGNKTVNATTLANVVNNVSHNITIGSTTDTFTDQEGKKDSQVKAGDTITLVSGKNLIAKQNGNEITFATADDVTFNNVSTNILHVPTGTGAADKPITITKDGISAGDKPISNVSSNLTNYTDDPRKPLVNLTAVPNSEVNNAATVSDLQRMGWVVSSDKTTGAETTPFSNAVTNAKEVKFVGTGVATVSGKLEGDVNTITVHVAEADAGLTTGNIYVNDGTDNNGSNASQPAGTVTPNTTNGTAATVADVANAVNNSGFKVTDNGKETNELLNAGETLNFNNGTGTTAVVETKDGVTNVTYNSALAYVDPAKPTDTSTPTDTVKVVSSTEGTPAQIQNVASGVRDTVKPATAGAPTGKEIADAIKAATGNTLTNAVNIGDLQAATNAARTEVKSEDGSITVTPSENATTGAPVYDVKVATTNLTTNPNGTVKQPDAEEGNKTVNATTLANVVNNVSHNITIGSTKDTFTDQEGKKDSQVKAGDTITLVSGKNLIAKQNGNEITFATADDVTFNNVSTNILHVPTGTGAADKPITITKDGISAGDKPISNVSSNLTNYTDDPRKPLVNLTAVPNSEVNNAATVSDLQRMGWVVSSDKTTGAETTPFSNAVTNAKEVKFVGTGVATVSGKLEGDVNTITVHVAEADAGLTTGNIYVNDGTDNNGSNASQPAGTVTPNTTNGTAATVADVANAVNNSGFKVTDNGKETNELLNAGETLNFNNGTGTRAVVETKDGVTNVTYNSALAYVDPAKPTDTSTPTDTVKVVSSTEGTPAQIQNVASGVRDTVKPATAGAPTGKEIADAIKAATGNTLTNAVNIGDLQAATNAARTEVKSEDGSITVTPSENATTGAPVYDVKVATTNLTTNPNGTVKQPDAEEGNKTVNATTLANVVNNVSHNITIGSTKDTFTDQEGKKDSQVKAGDTITLVSGKNLIAKQNGNEITFATADDVTFNNVSTNILHVPTGTGAADKPITITKDGISAGDKPISNVSSNLTNYTDDPRKPLVNLTAVPNSEVNNAATVSDLQRMGWVVSSDKTTGAETTPFSNAVTNAKEVKFVGTGVATVSGKLEGDVNTITVHVAEADAGLTTGNIYVNDGTDNNGSNASQPAGTVTPNTTNGTAATVADVANAVNNSGFKVTDNGKETNELLNAGETLNFNNGTGTTAVVETKDGVTNVTYNSALAYVDPTKPTDTSTPTDTVKVVSSTEGTPAQIQNVASGVRDTVKPATAGAPTGKEIADAIKAATGNTLTNAVNIGDLQAAANAAKTEVKSPNATIVVTPNTTAAADGHTIYEVEVANTTLAVSKAPTTANNNTPAGKVEAPTGDNTTKFVNAKDLADVINNAGFNVVSGKTGSGVNTGSTTELINPGETVKFIAGDNINIAQDGNNFAISTSHAPKFENNVTIGGAKTDSTGAPVVTANDGNIYKAGDVNVDGSPKTGATPVAPTDVKEAPAVTFKVDAPTNATNNPDTNKPSASLNVTSVDGKPTQITGVGSTLNTTSVATMPAGDKVVTDPAKQPQLVNLTEPTVNSNAVATVGDLQNMGWTVSVSDQYKDVVKNANEVRFVGTNNATVTGKTTDDGIREITIDVQLPEAAQLPVVYTTKNTDPATSAAEPNVKVVKVGDKFYKAGDVVNGNVSTGAQEIPATQVVASMNTGDNNASTPMNLNNIQGNLAPTYNAGNNLVEDATNRPTGATVAPNSTDITKSAVAPTADEVKEMYNNAATVGDVLNAGWNLQENNTAKDFVKAYDTVNFVNGTGTTANVTVDANGTIANVTFNSALGYVGTDGNITTANDQPNAPTNTVKLVGADKAAPVLVQGANSGVSPVTNINTTQTGNQTLTDANKKAIAEAITNANGTTLSNVANIGDVQSAAAAAKTEVKSPNATIVVTPNTTAAADGHTIYEVEVANTTLAVSKAPTTANNNTPAGKVEAPTGDNTTKFVNAKDLADVINNAGFNVVSGKTGSGVNTGSTTELINPGETVKFIAGDNINIAQDGNNFAISTSHAPKFENNVTIGGAKTDSTGAPVVTANDGNIYKAGDVNVDGSPKTGATPVAPADVKEAPAVTFKVDAPTNATNNPDTNKPSASLNVTSVDGKPTQITGVGSTLNTTSVATMPAGDKVVTDPAKQPQLVNLTEPTVNSNAVATVGDLQNMGWTVSVSDQYKDVVKNANEVRFVGTNNATVTGKTTDDGIREITIDVQLPEAAQLPVVYTTKNTDPATSAAEPNVKVVKVGDKFYKAGDVVNGNVSTGAQEIPATQVVASMNTGDNNASTPMNLNNIQGNLAPTYNAGNNLVEDATNRPTGATVAPNSTDITKSAVAPTADEVKEMYNNAATVGDVLNAGWNLQENNTAKDFVKAYDTVNFVNGTGTTANVTVDANGTIANVTFNSALGYVGTDGNITTANDQPNAPTNTVKLVGADKAAPVLVQGANSGVSPVTNINTTQTGDQKLSDGDKKAIAEAITNANGTTLSNVANIGDVQSAAAAAKTEVESKGNTIAVTNRTGNNGQVIYNVEVNTTTLTPNANGTVSAPNNATEGNKTVNATNLADAINKSGFTVSANGTNGTVVNPGETVDLNNTDGNIVITKGTDNNNVTFNLADIVKVGHSNNTSNPITINSNTGKIDGLTNNLPDTYNNDVYNTAGNNVTTSAPLPANLNVKNAATVGDILNSGWNVQGNGEAKDFVKPYDTVNFVNGTGTTAVVETDKDGKVTNVTFNVNSQGLSNNTQMPVVYTLKDGTRVYPSPTVDANGNRTFTTNPDGTGTQHQPDQVIASMNSAGNQTTAPTLLSNVQGNLAPTYNAGDNIIDANHKPTNVTAPVANVSKSQAAPTPANVSAMYNNAATVGDVLNAGWNLQENGAEKDFVKAYDAVNFVNGTGTTANVTVTEDGKIANVTFNSALAYVDNNGSTTNANGTPNSPTNTVKLVGSSPNSTVTITGATSGLTPNTLNINPILSTSPNVPNPQTTSLLNFSNNSIPDTKNDTVATVGDLRNMGWVVSARGNNYSDAVKSSNEVEFVGENGVSVTGVTQDGKRIITIKGVTQAVSVGNTGTAQLGNVTGGNVTGGTGNTTSPTNPNATTPVGNTLVTAQDVVNTVNNVSWNSTVANIGSGVSKVENANSSIKAGDTMKFTAGNNMNLTLNGTNLTVATNDNVTFNTVNATNVSVAPNGGSLTVGGNSTVDVGGNKIQNVANGTLSPDSKDAVNGSQLYQIYSVVGGDPTKVGTTNGTTSPVTLANGTTTNVTTIPASPNSNVTSDNPNLTNNTAISGNYTMVTYNVEGQKNYITNNVVEAIGRMNEQGIRFFHTNDGTGKPRAIQGQNTEDSSASGAYSTAIGHRSEAAGENSISFGKESQALGKDSIAIGTGNIVTGQGSGAFGDPSLVMGNASYSIGNNNKLAYDDTFAVGSNVTQTVENSVFLGKDTGYTYASGTDKDLIVKANTAIAEFAQAESDHGNATTVLQHAEIGVKGYTESLAKAREDLATIQANATLATAENVTKAETLIRELGVSLEKANVTLTNAQAVVANTSQVLNASTTARNTAIAAVKADEANKVATSIATSKGRTAGNSKALTQQDVAGGVNKYAGGNETVGVVSVGVETTVHNATTNSTTTVMQTRRIQNVAPGLLSEESTDAINGSQLYAVGTTLNNKIDGVAGRVTKLEGDVVNLNQKVDDNANNTIAVTKNGGQVGGTGNRLDFINGTGTSVEVTENVNHKGDGKPTVSIQVNTPMAYVNGNTTVDENGKIGGDVSTPSNTVTMVGEGGTINAPVQLTNVASGVRLPDGTELQGKDRAIAVYNAQGATRNNAANIGDIQAVAGDIHNRIDDVEDQADAGTAMAMAAAGLPQVYLPGKSMVSVAGSTYKGKVGYAVGFSAITDGGDWIIKGSVGGHSKGKFGATIGAGYQW